MAPGLAHRDERERYPSPPFMFLELYTAIFLEAIYQEYVCEAVFYHGEADSKQEWYDSMGGEQFISILPPLFWERYDDLADEFGFE